MDSKGKDVEKSIMLMENAVHNDANGKVRTKKSHLIHGIYPTFVICAIPLLKTK